MLYEYDFLSYCVHCDGTFREDDLVLIPVGDWGVRYACPICGDESRVYLSDTYFDTGLYLLSVADDDWTWPGDGTRKLPKYEE